MKNKGKWDRFMEGYRSFVINLIHGGEIREWKETEKFFYLISEPLNEFANKYGLYLRKYPQHSHSWTFYFRHPKGGDGSITIHREKNNSFSVYPSWGIDDFENYKSYIKWDRTGKLYALKTTKLVPVLTTYLEKILRWELGQWSVITDCRYEWSKYSKAEWEKMRQVYPYPKMDAD